MYEQMTLPNGVRVVTEQVNSVRSAAIGIWVGTGSRQEKAGEGGAAHFIEHMLFKGTATRSAADIARETDAIGGQINAFTTKECTCFYAKVLDNHVEQVLDILWDMVYCSRFDQKDVETERGVILEEIGMYQDAPDDLCAERLFAAVYQGSSLGRPILGKAATLNKFTGEYLRDYQKRHYWPENTVVSLSGSFPPSVVQEIKTRFSTLESGKAPSYRAAIYQPAVTIKRKTTEQNHLTLAFPGLSYLAPERFTLQLLSSILGGGMSSRLFQEVREKRGLCYSVYSYGAGHEDTGVFNVYTALNREMEKEALSTICTVIEGFVAHGPEQEELDRAREQSKANVLMGLESTQSRMSHMGRSLLFAGEILSPEDIIEAYDSVTRRDVMDLACEIFRFENASLSAVGKVAPKEDYEAFLKRT
ncbi:MAG: peptidase [Evtepia sp.]|jgi:predicted Zn-dependent peptidase|nr:peptidase [Evtepia sp.]